MSTKIYVENLAAAMTERELENLFSTYGNVAGVNIAVDHASKAPRAFGFVTMMTSEGALAAINALNGKVIDAGPIKVTEAWPENNHRKPRRSASTLF